MKSKQGGLYLYLLIAVVLVLAAVIRIATLPVHGALPRLPNHQDGYYDYEGVIHYHTAYSADAMGSYKELGVIGNRKHLDFLITTEHNNFLAFMDHQEGWYDNMLTLVGIESTRHEGYLLGLNLKASINRDDSTDDVLTAIDAQGGYTIIAHPDSPRWRWRGKVDPRIAGQEILDMTDQFNESSGFDLIKSFLSYPFNPPAAILQLYHRPDQALSRWDNITTYRHFIGIYAPDVHASIRIWGTLNLPLPMSKDILPIAHNHVILTTPFTKDFEKDKANLYEAIRQGRIYVAIDTLQDATGFFFSASQGNKTAWMGDQLAAGPKTDFMVKLPQPLRFSDAAIHVFHNGQLIQSTNGPSTAFQAALPGAYRVEVEVGIPTFWGFNKRVIWIYSNPIYLR